MNIFLRVLEYYLRAVEDCEWRNGRLDGRSWPRHGHRRVERGRLHYRHDLFGQ